MIAMASHEDFQQFVEPTNYPAQILLLDFTLIEFIIGEIVLGEGVGARFGFRRRASLAWLNGMLDTVPEEYQMHLEWPLKYAEYLAAGLTGPFIIPNPHPRLRLLRHVSPQMSNSITNDV